MKVLYVRKDEWSTHGSYSGRCFWTAMLLEDEATGERPFFLFEGCPIVIIGNRYHWTNWAGPLEVLTGKAKGSVPMAEVSLGHLRSLPQYGSDGFREGQENLTRSYFEAIEKRSRLAKATETYLAESSINYSGGGDRFKFEDGSVLNIEHYPGRAYLTAWKSYHPPENGIAGEVKEAVLSSQA